MNFKQLTLIMCMIGFSSYVKAQAKIFQSFRELSGPEKRWALSHPFIAQKAHALTQEVLQMQDTVKEMGVIDSIGQGGQLDAFRHSYWMALLAQHFPAGKVRRLGIAHEKGNYHEFLELKDSGKMHPDLAMTQMDLHNNDVGILIGRNNRKLDREQLRDLVIDYINAGRLLVVKTDLGGNFLDGEGNIIPEERLTGSWENGKILLPSNWREIKGFLNKDP